MKDNITAMDIHEDDMSAIWYYGDIRALNVEQFAVVTFEFEKIADCAEFCFGERVALPRDDHLGHTIRRLSQWEKKRN